MKLSIITVNLNNRDGLQKTIDSVVSQTFKDFEWIVIDGGSTDGSKELIEQYADHFTYWVSEPDKGIYHAMNKGIKMAKGDYLQFLNSGDYLFANNTLGKAFSILFNADIVYGDIAFMDNGEIVEIREYPDTLSFAKLYSLSLPHPSTFIKSVLLKEHPYDETLKIVSDWKFFLRKALDGCTFQHINATLTVFNMFGISSVNPALVNTEKEITGRCVVPACILTDVHQLNLMDTDWQITSFLEYRSKRKIYHKLFTLVLLTIKHIDHLFPPRKKCK